MTTDEPRIDENQSTMTEPTPAFHYLLASLLFSDGTTVSLAEDDTVVIVGGNNVGKSQALKEIVKQIDSDTGHDESCVVVKGVTLSVSEQREALNAFVKQLEIVRTEPSPYVGRMGNNMRSDTIDQWLSHPQRLTDNLRRGLRAFTTYLVNTENRLQITNPAPSIDLLRSQKGHPFHYLADDVELEDQISTAFKKAFGVDLIVNRTAGSHIHLHVGARPFPSLVYNLDERSREQIFALPTLNDQGDGMRAFVGCLMWGTVVNYNIVMIDEPEAFLHPPQARLLGKTMVRRKKPNTQLILATHSGDLLRGTLDSGSPNLRILRLAREGQTNRVNELRPEDVRLLTGDSLLRQTNVLDALFHQLTIVCESDADCQFYSSIAAVLAEASDERQMPDALFLPSNGTRRMASVVAPLHQLGVPVRVVADFDLLRDEIPLRPIFEALGGNWASVNTDWTIVEAAVSSRKAQLDKTDLKNALDVALAKVSGDIVPDSVLKEIKDAARKASAWAYAKTTGEGFLPSGDVFNRYRRIKSAFQAVGLYIVHKGELESFCKSVDDHGPAWVEQVCKKNLADDRELHDAREFVESFVWPSPPEATDSRVAPKQLSQPTN